MTRWAADVRLGWHPILTFERRRIELLDWVEDNVDYSGFTDKPDLVGIAVGSLSSRVEFRRQGLTLSIDGTRGKFVDFDELLAGALRILEPKHPRLISVRSSWAEPVDGPYEDLCRRFASQMAFAFDADDFWAADASSLVDFVTPQAQLQCEFGIVKREELGERLRDPTLSRLRETDNRPALVPLDRLPEVSMYGGITWVPLDVVSIDQASDVSGNAATALSESGRLIESLSSRFVRELGGTA